MSKRPHNSHAPTAASVDLVERFKAAANDTVLLRELVEGNDSGPVAAAFAALLADGGSSAPNGSKLRKKAPNRPCRSLPVETFVEVLLFADRDTLDSMQLVCSFLLNSIRERELTQLALRAISKVIVGSWEDYDDGQHWLPLVEMVHDHAAGNDLVPNSVHHLASCMRMAYCETVCIDLMGGPDEGAALDAVCRMLFHDLVAPNTFVGMFTTFMCNVEMVARGIEAFKSVKSVSAVWHYGGSDDWLPLGDAFFGSAARHGVRNIEFNLGNGDATPANTAAALSFGFAEPAVGGDRGLLGVACEAGADLLAQVKQKVAELTEAHDVDFNFKLANVSAPIASAGFEKYQIDDDRTWLIKDLENHINVQVKQTDNLVEIHVFSSL